MGDIPTAIAEGVIKLPGLAMRVYVLDDGKRIIDAEDVGKFVAWMDTASSADVELFGRLFAQTLLGPRKEEAT